MMFDNDTDQKSEGPVTLAECAMLVVGYLLAPIAIGLWAALIFWKIAKLPVRLMRLWARNRQDLPGARAENSHQEQH